MGFIGQFEGETAFDRTSMTRTAVEGREHVEASNEHEIGTSFFPDHPSVGHPVRLGFSIHPNSGGFRPAPRWIHVLRARVQNGEQRSRFHQSNLHLYVIENDSASSPSLSNTGRHRLSLVV
jgi:hypothetical protein